MNEALIELPKCNINYFKLRQKSVMSTGPCSILNSGSSLTFKSDRTKIEIPKKTMVARLQEVAYMTYIALDKEDGVNTFSVPAGDFLNESLDNILKEQFEVVDYFSLPPDLEFKKKIIDDCPIGQAGGPELGVTNDDKLNQIGESIGNVFGGISSILDMDKINKSSNETISRLSKDYLGERVLSKWQRFKNKCSELNDVVTEVFKPVNQKCKKVASDIGENLEKSENSIIKGVREYSRKTQVALNSGYDKADGPRRASYMPGNQGDGQGRSASINLTSVQTSNNSNIVKDERLNERKSLL